MASKRIIACVRVRDGRLVIPATIAGVGNVPGPVEAAEALARAGADEIILIDGTATVDGRRIGAGLVEAVAKRVKVPVLAGGGVRSVDDARELYDAGAARLVLNSAAIANSGIIADLSAEFGVERVVVGVDARKEGAGFTVHTHSGARNTHIDAITWVQETEAQGAGEIFVTSLDTTGTGRGFDLDLVSAVADEIEIPVIAGGGGGTLEHFADLLQGEKPAGAVAASAFLTGKFTPQDVKEFLRLR